MGGKRVGWVGLEYVIILTTNGLALPFEANRLYPHFNGAMVLDQPPASLLDRLSRSQSFSVLVYFSCPQSPFSSSVFEQYRPPDTRIAISPSPLPISIPVPLPDNSDREFGPSPPFSCPTLHPTPIPPSTSHPCFQPLIVSPALDVRASCFWLADDFVVNLHPRFAFFFVFPPLPISIYLLRFSRPH